MNGEPSGPAIVSNMPVSFPGEIGIRTGGAIKDGDVVSGVDTDGTIILDNERQTA